MPGRRREIHEAEGQLALDIVLLVGELRSHAPALATPAEPEALAPSAAAGGEQTSTCDPGPGGSGPIVVDEQRLPHPNPHGCAALDCSNRATLQLTFDSGARATVCRPHAVIYRRQIAPDAAPIDGFTRVERARIRNAVRDEAARYSGGPFGFGRGDAARYTSEGHLVDLVDKHGLGAVWEAVAAIIDAEPE